MQQSELEQFYDINAQKVYRFFFYKILNREIAEDLTSKTFLAFAKNLQSDKKIDNAHAFLMGIANNVFNVFLKEKYKHHEIPITEELENSLGIEDEEYIETFDIIDLLERVIDRVPEKQALVLRLRFIDKLSINEICEKLGRDENYVSTTQKRAFKSLRAVLECTDMDTNIVEE